MDTQQQGIQEDDMRRVNSICSCNIGDKGENTVSSSINMGNIETKVTGTVSSIVRACDTDASHQNRIDDLDLAKTPKAFIELYSRRVSYFCNVLLLQLIMMYDIKIIINGYCYKGS